MMVAYIFVLLGIVSEKTATRLIYFDVMLYSVGGVVGTMHHCYFSGTPAVQMALGAFFSAAEVIPLTFLTVEAWTFLQLGARQEIAQRRRRSFPHRWAVLFLASVGFWNFLGAGVFGFLINLPVVSYYEIGTQLTANHGHAAFMGVYGMLAIALLVFCMRYLLRPEDWSERLVGFSFWALNLGLADDVRQPVPAGRLATRRRGGQWLLARALLRILRQSCGHRVAASAGRSAVHSGRGSAGVSDGKGRLPTGRACGGAVCSRNVRSQPTFH